MISRHTSDSGSICNGHWAITFLNGPSSLGLGTLRRGQEVRLYCAGLLRKKMCSSLLDCITCLNAYLTDGRTGLHTDRRTDRYTDGQAYAQTDGHTDRRTHRRTDIQTDGQACRKCCKKIRSKTDWPVNDKKKKTKANIRDIIGQEASNLAKNED